MQYRKELSSYPSVHRIFEYFHEEEDAVFLDSSLRNHLGRYSIIGLHPYLKLIKGKEFIVNGQVSDVPFERFVKDYLERHREENVTGLPLVSGAIGYFSYDYGRKKEGVDSRHGEEVKVPDSILNFYDDFIIEDGEKGRLFLISNGKLGEGEASVRSLEEAIVCISKEGKPALPEKSTKNPAAIHSNFRKEDYLQAVQDMIHYIMEGDIYIANMTQQLKIKSNKSPYELFKTLRKNNPSPFGGYFNYGGFQIVSASPERFLQMKNRRVETRPIKGTRKRGATPEEDIQMREELEASEKDKSELLMIVDLERNDLNRVCVPGSVEVTELFTVEAYATVFHLVANIIGTLREGRNVMDLIEASFPGGSITGAPKLRAMEIIDELEHGRRNLYTGSMGWLSLSGDCDFNIVIRTAFYQDGTYHLGVGGGITSESELEFEYEETLQKAKAILEALHE